MQKKKRGKYQRITQVMPLCRKTGKARYHHVDPSSEISREKMENYWIICSHGHKEQKM